VNSWFWHQKSAYLVAVTWIPLITNSSVGMSLQVKVTGVQTGYQSASSTSQPYLIAPVPPTAPRLIRFSKHLGTPILTWSPPSFNGGFASIAYLVIFTYRVAKLQGRSVASFRTNLTSLKILPTKFHKGSKYCAQVSASNQVGSGPNSPRICFTY
jgi:hypothetical protein